jgi:hypothetical protein
MLPEPDNHECLKTHADSGGVHVGVEPPEDTVVPEALHPLRTGRWRDPHSGGERLVGQATIVLEELDNSPVCSVEIGFAVHRTNLLR